jgi:hypothetical protein
MQWLAMITMVIDHIGVVWFPDESMWRVIGRIAFPIYAYFVAVGMTRTRSPKRYLVRLLLLGIVSQIPYTLLFDDWVINVIGSFFVIVGALYLAEASSNPGVKMFWYAGGAAVLQLLPVDHGFDYGAYGLLLVAIFRYVKSGWLMVLLHTLLNVMYCTYYNVPVQYWSVVPTAALAAMPITVRHAAAVPRMVWRLFYPVHLLILYLVLLIKPS